MKDKQQTAAERAEEYKAELKEAFGFDPDKWREEQLLENSKSNYPGPVSFWVDFKLGFPLFHLNQFKNSFHNKSKKQDEEETD